MMNLFRSAPELAFRREVQAFLKESLPADLAASGGSGYDAGRADSLRWQQILHARGWGAPHWPVEEGGAGWSAAQRMIFDEELALSGAPATNSQGLHLVGPVICAFGTPEQKRRFLTPIIRGDLIWCQGFSEPGAGSDLAALRTRAIRGDDHYAVTGQKIWTSHAHFADWVFLLVRTDDTERKQQGISFLLVDLLSPGITIRPLPSIDGQHHLNEVFYDNVSVPVENRVGEEGKGWDIAKFLLMNERGFVTTDVPNLKFLLSRIKRIARQEIKSGRPLIQDSSFALRLARFEMETLALEMAVFRLATQDSTIGGPSAATGSMLKVRAGQLRQALTELQLEAIGDSGAVFYPHLGASSAEPTYAPGIATQYFYRRAASIIGGTDEIQRNIIAKSLLGA